MYDNSNHQYFIVAEAENTHIDKTINTNPKAADNVPPPVVPATPASPAAPAMPTAPSTPVAPPRPATPATPVAPARPANPSPVPIQTPVEVENVVKPDPIVPDDTNKKVVVEDGTVVKPEGIVSACFAKEEFTLETAETDCQHNYMFKSNNNNIDKDKVAKIIKDRVDLAVVYPPINRTF